MLNALSNCWIFLIFQVIVFSSCTLKDAEFEDPVLSDIKGTRIGIPLLDSKVNFERFLSEEYKKTLEVDSDGYYIYKHEDTGESISLEDLVLKSLGYHSMNNFFELERVSIAEQLASTNTILDNNLATQVRLNFVMDDSFSKEVRLSQEEVVFDFPLTNVTESDKFALSFVEFKEGKAILEIKPKNLNSEISVELRNVKEEESSPDFITVKGDLVKELGLFRFEVPLKGKVLDFWDDENKRALENTPELIISSNESFQIESFAFSSDQELTAVKVWFKENHSLDPIVFPAQSPNFNLDQAFLGDGKIKIKKIHTSISLENPLNLELRVNSELAANFTDGSDIKDVLGDDKLLIIPAKSNSSIAIKNAEDLLEITPKKRLSEFVFSGKIDVVSEGKEYIEAQEELLISSEAKFKINYLIFFPLELSFEDLSYETSFEVNVGDVKYEVADAEFRVYTQSDAPFNMRMDWLLENDKGELVDRFDLGNGGVILKAANSDTTELISKFPIGSDFIEKLKSTKKTKLIFKLDSDLDQDGAVDYVRLNARNNFVLQAGVVANFDLNFDSIKESIPSSL